MSGFVNSHLVTSLLRFYLSIFEEIGADLDAPTKSS
jgi:hypothetical protein